MREKFINFTINHIRNKNGLTTNEERICTYSLYAIYSFITKTTVILLLAFSFNVFNEALLLMLFCIILRTFAFGLHANKNLHCWFFSIITYVFFPILIKYVNLPDIYYYSLFLLFVIPLIIYSPADTPKRPLVKKEKRIRNQKIIAIISIIYLITSSLSPIYIINNTILFAIIFQSICVNPLTYKLFNIKYNNYLFYKLSKV